MIIHTDFDICIPIRPLEKGLLSNPVRIWQTLSLVCVIMFASTKRVYGDEVVTRKGTAALDSLRNASRCTSPGTLLLSSDGVEKEVVLAPSSALIRYWPRNRWRDIWCTRFYLMSQMDSPGR